MSQASPERENSSLRDAATISDGTKKVAFADDAEVEAAQRSSALQSMREKEEAEGDGDDDEQLVFQEPGQK